MIALTLLLAAQSAETAGAGVPLPVRAKRFQIPAIDAYSECYLARLDHDPPPVEQRRAELAGTRDACRAAIRLRLDRGEFAGISRRPRSEGRGDIERVFDGLDAQLAAMYMKMSGRQRLTPFDRNRGDASAGVVTVPREVAPFYWRYIDCVVAAQDPEPAGTAVGEAARWKAAFAACRTTKAALVAEADQALARRGRFRGAKARARVIREALDGYELLMLTVAAGDAPKGKCRAAGNPPPETRCAAGREGLAQ